MSAYKKYPNLHWWVVNLDHHTLTQADKAVLDLDYYCRPHGNRLSHRNAAKMLHLSERQVSLSRKKLEKLLLRRSEIAKGSCKVGFPIEYKNQAEWRAQLRANGMLLGGAKNAPRCSKKKRPLRGLSSSHPKKEAGEKPPAREFTHPLTPPSRGACGSVWKARRSHPQWRKLLGWGYGSGMTCAEAETEADYRFALWLKAQESKEKEICKNTKDQPADTSAP